MPWKVRQGGGCPPSKPWAVVLEADGSTVACHPTKSHAEAHMKALYANVPEAKGYTAHGWTVDEPAGLTASAWKPAGILDEFDNRYLSKMTAALADTFKQMRALTITRLRASALVASPFTLDDPNVFTAQDWADMFSVDAVDIIGDVVVDAATGSPLKIGLNLSDDDLANLVDAHVKHLFGVGADVAQSVSDTMQVAVKDGWSIEQTARELSATGPFTADGARSFARTEISSAANAGMVAGWFADGVPFKRWGAVGDAKTRFAHAVADGTTMPTGQDFDIGGWPASAPGDLRLPSELRVNCRCVSEPVDGHGAVRAASLDTAGKKDLYRLAAQLKVRGRSTMTKGQLFDTIDAYRRGEGVQRIDRQTRAQLLARAKVQGIAGRHGMDAASLRAELFARAPGARRALDAGYVVEGELAAIRQQVASVLQRMSIVAAAGWVVE